MSTRVNNESPYLDEGGTRYLISELLKHSGGTVNPEDVEKIVKEMGVATTDDITKIFDDYKVVESDPTVSDHVKSITTDDIARWNNKADKEHTHTISDITDMPTYATESYVDNAISGAGNVTEEEKAIWNAKADSSIINGLASESYVTSAISNINYAKPGDSYTKTESDENYLPKNDFSWKLVGSVTGNSNSINLPEKWNEIYIRAYADSWMSLSIFFPQNACGKDVTRHFYTGKGVWSGAPYMDELIIEVSGVDSLKLFSWTHNEGSTTTSNWTNKATLDVFYR